MLHPQLIEKKDLHRRYRRIRIRAIFWTAVIFLFIGIVAGYAWHMEAVKTNVSVLRTELANMEIHHKALVAEHGRWIAVYPDPDPKLKMPRKGPK